jgi:membrane protein DedA with SNARE-associated domain
LGVRLAVHDHFCGDGRGGHALFAGGLAAVHRGCHVRRRLDEFASGHGFAAHSSHFSRRGFDQAHAFYEKYGGITIILARFMPFVRTFVPFVAGVAEMTRSKFTYFNVVGAVIWVVGLLSVGYLFGNLPIVQEHLSKIIWALIIVPGLIAVFGAWKARQAS